jgi:hypothetical protein
VGKEEDGVRVGGFPYQPMRAEHEFIGVVYDACNNMKVVEIDSFRTAIDGTPGLNCSVQGVFGKGVNQSAMPVRK